MNALRQSLVLLVLVLLLSLLWNRLQAVLAWRMFRENPFLARFTPGRRRRQRLLDQLRLSWGHEIARDRKMEAIVMYHADLKDGRMAVDEQTWQDLAMDELFAKLDRTAGWPGRQVLYRLLRVYEEDDKVLAERTRQYRILQDDAALRENLQLVLGRLERPDAEWMAPTLLNTFPAVPRFAWLYFLLSFTTVACLIGIIFVHQLLFVALLLVFVNIGINVTYGREVRPHFPGFSQITELLGVSTALAEVADPHQLPQLAELRRANAAVAKLRKRLGWVVMDRRALPELAAALFEYLNMICLFDILMFLRSVSALRPQRETLVGIFHAVGSLDASIAVASYLRENPRTTVPQLVDDRQLEVTGLYHPLIPNPVSNSLHLAGRSALVAGPNMAGKTAFIRTIGINVLLARTLNFCLAEHAILPRAIVRSSIRREDKLSDGQSYFFAEIKQLLDFIRLGESDQRYLFLIDEIYRGTNTIERVSASAAVLRHLGQRQMVFATTHDSELQELLVDAFDMVHFRDQVVDGAYSFNYHLEPGPARTRNAIKLLEFSGYPASITNEAQLLAEQIAATAAAKSAPLGAGPTA